MNTVNTGMYSPLIGFSRVLREAFELFYQPIKVHLLTCGGLISFFGTLAALGLVTLGCVSCLLDLKKVDGHQLVVAGVLIFCMLQCLMANLHWLFLLV